MNAAGNGLTFSQQLQLHAASCDVLQTRRENAHGAVGCGTCLCDAQYKVVLQGKPFPVVASRQYPLFCIDL